MVKVPGEWLALVSTWSTPAILIVAAAHWLAFVILVWWSRRDLLRLVGDLEGFTRGLQHRSVLDRHADLTDQIDAFLADVRDVLEQPQRGAERAALAQRMQILDEERRYLQSHRFETCYTVCRTMIEAYPLAGVLGTILAIGAALQVGAGSDAGTVTAIVRYFGDAIWSTFAGLTAAIGLMFTNSLVETRFLRLGEIRTQVRETVARAKRELALASTGMAGGPG